MIKYNNVLCKIKDCSVTSAPFLSFTPLLSVALTVIMFTRDGTIMTT